MREPDLDVLILGGGISGLSTAHALLRERPGLRLRLLESAPRLGGALGSEVAEGFVFERGPNGFLDNVPETLELAEQLGLGASLLSADSAAARRYLLKGGRLDPLPTGGGQFLRSGLLTARGKLRLLVEPFQPRAPEGQEDSVASFGRRRIGEEATMTLLDPLVTGVYAGDVERLSIEAAFPKVAALEREHGSLFRALWRRRRAAKARAREAASPSASAASATTASATTGAKAPARARPEGGPAGPGGVLTSFRGGLEDLARALAGRLGARATTGAHVESVSPRDGFTARIRGGGSVVARALVVALPAPRAASVFSAWNPNLASDLEEIPYASVAVVCLGYRREDVGHPLDGFGFLVPRSEGLRILGSIWVSSIFPAHVPAGHVSLRVLVGGARDPEVIDLSPDELGDLVLRELGPVLSLRGEPKVRRIYRYAQGIPQYNVGHFRRVRRVEAWLQGAPGLFLAGNAYRGVGINDCVRESSRVASRVLAFLGDGPAQRAG